MSKIDPKFAFGGKGRSITEVDRKLNSHCQPGGLKWVEMVQLWSDVGRKFLKELRKTVSYMFTVRERQRNSLCVSYYNAHIYQAMNPLKLLAGKRG